jgi:hypothetical protein
VAAWARATPVQDNSVASTRMTIDFFMMFPCAQLELDSTSPESRRVLGSAVTLRNAM